MLMVSDFKISASTLRRICRSNGVNFVDVPLSFEKPDKGSLFVGKTKNLSHTMYKIVSEYIKKSPLIVGKDLFPDQGRKEHFLTILANNFRYFLYRDNKFYSEIDEPHCIRLYQKPLVWILLKDCSDLDGNY